VSTNYKNRKAVGWTFSKASHYYGFECEFAVGRVFNQPTKPNELQTMPKAAYEMLEL